MRNAASAEATRPADGGRCSPFGTGSRFSSTAQAARPEAVLDGCGVDLVGLERAAAGVFGHLAGHGDDLLASAVAQRKGEHHVFSLGARGAQLLERIAHAGRQAIELADGVEADPVVEDLAPLALEV